MRTITLILVLATLAVLIIYGCVIAANGALGQVADAGGTHPPESSPNMPVLPPPACQIQGQLVGAYVLLWVEDADPSETLDVWLLTPEGRLLSGVDKWPLLIPARPGDWVLVVRRGGCRICVHPYTITPAEELETTKGEVN